MARIRTSQIDLLPDTPLSLQPLRERYVREGRPLPRALEETLRADPRPGAAAILKAIQRRRQQNRTEGQRLRRVTRFERALWDAGYMRVAGVDEAGMSPLAGPVVAAAVVVAPGTRWPKVDDSKKLSAAQRQELAQLIRSEALGVGVGHVDPEEIDQINIYHAGLAAMQRAVSALPAAPDYLLVDARTVPGQTVEQESIVKGDQKSLAIAAASIIAKTTRDSWMVELDQKYPGYGFAKHKGYPVKAHVEALQKLGVTPVHRRSFTPVRLACGLAEQNRAT